MENKAAELIVTTLLNFHNQYKIFHWQTKSYAQHKAFGKIYDNLTETIDTFVETFMGKYGRVIASSTFDLTLNNYDESFADLNEEFIAFLSDELPSYLADGDTDLTNIRDEILGDVNQLKYLLTLS